MSTVKHRGRTEIVMTGQDQVAQALPKARQTYEAENSGIPDDQIPPRPVRDGSPVQLAGLERDEET